MTAMGEINSHSKDKLNWVVRSSGNWGNQEGWTSWRLLLEMTFDLALKDGIRKNRRIERF